LKLPRRQELRAATPAFETMASQGDPRVLFLMNLVLSAVFATVVIWGLSIVTAVAFEWRTVGIATLGLMLLTWLVVMR